MRRSPGCLRPVFCAFAGWVVLAASAAIAAPFAQLPEKQGCTDVYFHVVVDLPQGKILRAWTAISATHEYVLYINGKEASRSRYGRVAGTFRMAREIENLAEFLRPGKNTLTMKAHRWSPGVPTLNLQAEVQIEGQEAAVPIATDASWVGAYEAPANWTAADFAPAGWQAVTIKDLPTMGPRIRRDQEALIAPSVPAPLSEGALKALPQIADMSVWQQQVVSRDLNADTQRLMKIFQTKFVAQCYAEAISHHNTNMGDSFSINGFPVGNGTVLTIMGPYPFCNTNVIVGPEYQYPVQWNAGTTFLGDAVSVSANGQPLGLGDQWMWKIRQTDVVVSAASDPARTAVFYTLTFAPPGMKALMRLYAVANPGKTPLKNVVITHTNGRTKVAGKTLTETVNHPPMPDAAGDSNVRSIVTGVLDDANVTALRDEKANTGTLSIALGDLAPGQCKTCLVYHITTLDSVNGKPVAPEAANVLAAVKARGLGLLDDTIKYWRDYHAGTTTLDAPGAWGRRVADFVDDEKMLVQVQQFERTGAVGPMWFFSDQWIRDSCGPMKSFLRTGKFENARRVIDYHYRAFSASRKILNWVPMDVAIDNVKPVKDWSEITMNHADRAAHCEVPSWVVLEHYWYLTYSGDTKTIAEHWNYLKRCFYGQFDNPRDNIFRPDFKIPFHGDETYIYSGGEGLWEDRYDLQQSSYPGGNIYSADSSFELVAAGEALAKMARTIGKTDDAEKIAEVTAKIRAATEKYYWMEDLGFYAQGMSLLCDGQLNRYPMANIDANVLWSGYGNRQDKHAVSNALRMAEYLMEDSGVINPILGYDVTVGMVQGQALHSLAAIQHPWAEKAFYALMMIAGDTTEFSEWMAPGPDFRTMYRANRIRPWEGGINLDAALYYLSGFEPDAPGKSMTLTPRLPTGVYSPIKWDDMTLRHLPLGPGSFDLTVADRVQGSSRVRTYTVASHSGEEVSVTLNALVPFAQITSVTVNGSRLLVEPSELYGQALATTVATLPAGQTLTVAVSYAPQPAVPVKIEMKPFQPTQPTFGASDVVVFTTLGPQKDRKLLREELAQKHKVLALDATLPTDAATFQAALLTSTGLRTHMLIMDEGSMSCGRKDTFWQDPQFDKVVGEFLRRGGIVLEANSRNTSSKWLEKTLAPAHYLVDYTRAGDAVALDAADQSLDDQFRWLDEKPAMACGKWAAYWAGQYTMQYVGGGPTINDGVIVFGDQETPDGCMEYKMNTTPGKDHLIRIRTWPVPKKGFTLQAFDKPSKTWKLLDTIWVPQPKDGVNGWVDVYLTLPAKYVTEASTSFRIGEPKGSDGGIGSPGHSSSALARVWIRDSLQKPPTKDQVVTRSAIAAKLRLRDKGVVSYSAGQIAQSGFIAPYRILGDSKKAAMILRPVGQGLYVKTELTSLFPVEEMAQFVEALLEGQRPQ